MTRRASNLLALASATALLAAGPLAIVAPASAAPEPILPVEWQRTVLTTDVQDPTDLDVAADGSVVIAERTGAIKIWKQDGSLTTAGTIPVSANASLTDAGGEEALEEGGIHGLLMDRNYLKNGRIYVFRSVPGTVKGPKNEGILRVSTFAIKGTTLDLKSEKKIIEIPAEWENCCHYGGDMEWMADGTILLTVGDDTSPRDEGWNPRDKRPGREAFNAERTSANKKDRRGKVLRFTADGRVPKDNPHVKDKRYDPYVYAMGFRSNYRMGHDQKSGVTFVGNVGPDAQSADATRGPAGHDELEVIPKKGGTNHGWPFCIGNNMPYQDYDYATGASKGALSCAGLTPAVLYYNSGPSETFPLAAAGARTQMAGPVYRYSGTGALQLPASFQNKLLHWDWSRGIMYATSVSDSGEIDISSMTPWSVATPNVFVGVGVAVPVGGPSAPMDMVVGPDGALYIPEYGSGYYQNSNSAITRISCFQCQSVATDYAGAPAVDPRAGDVVAESGRVQANTASAGVVANAAAPQGVLAATGAPVGLAVVGLVGLAAAAVLRRRSDRSAALAPVLPAGQDAGL